MKKRNILLGLALAFCFTACYDLDKMPEGVLSTAEPFRSTGEIRNYIDRYYEFWCPYARVHGWWWRWYCR